MDVNMKNLFIGNDLSPLPFSASQSCQKYLQRFGIESFGSLGNWAIRMIFGLIGEESLRK